MLTYILISLAGLVALLLAVAAARPAAYRVTRSREIAAPPGRVTDVLGDLREFAGILVLFGSPWEESDPGMRKNIVGPAAAGQTYAWESTKGAGKGVMTLDECVAGQRVGITIAFEKPMKSISTSAFTLAATPAGTAVTWAMSGRHNFLGRLIGLFMNMDAMLGRDIEMGLERLRGVAEGAL